MSGGGTLVGWLIILIIVLAIVILLIAKIMLVGRLIGVAQVTSAFIWCVFLVVLLFPWQAFLQNTDFTGDFKIPGVLYTWNELTHPTLGGLTDRDAVFTGMYGEVGRCRLYRQDLTRINAARIDARFIIDTLPGDPRVIVASPCSGHGFKHSPAIGEALADLAMHGHTTQFLLDEFKLPA